MAAGPAAVIEQDNVTSIGQFGNEARPDRMTAPVAVVEVGEGQETSDRSHTDIVSASAGIQGVPTRSLFEQTVTFAWIAIQPTQNALAWVRRDRAERKKAHNDLLSHGGPALLEPETCRTSTLSSRPGE